MVVAIRRSFLQYQLARQFKRLVRGVHVTLLDRDLEIAPTRRNGLIASYNSRSSYGLKGWWAEEQLYFTCTWQSSGVRRLGTITILLTFRSAGAGNRDREVAPTDGCRDLEIAPTGSKGLVGRRSLWDLYRAHYPFA